MVIQRLQSLYLFIAMVLMAVFAFVPSVAYSVDGNEFLLSPYGITTTLSQQTAKSGLTHLQSLNKTSTLKWKHF